MLIEDPLLLRTPIVPWSFFASRLYHDGYWYPTHGKPRVKQILGTEWGQLFEKHGRTGSINGEAEDVKAG